MQKKISSLGFLILFGFTVTSCARVALKDNEWCGDMGSEGAACFNTLSDLGRDIPKEQWDDERFGMLCTNSTSFANWKAAIEKLCDDTGRCDYEVRKAIENLEKKLNHFKTRVSDAQALQ